jgi:hypothetical protein
LPALHPMRACWALRALFSIQAHRFVTANHATRSGCVRLRPSRTRSRAVAAAQTLRVSTRRAAYTLLAVSTRLLAIWALCAVFAVYAHFQGSTHSAIAVVLGCLSPRRAVHARSCIGACGVKLRTRAAARSGCVRLRPSRTRSRAVAAAQTLRVSTRRAVHTHCPVWSRLLAVWALCAVFAVYTHR